MSDTTILVIGDSCTDVFLYGTCDRICPEAPVPVFNPTREVMNKGMAGNVFENLRGLGARYVHIETNNDNIIKTRYVEEKSNQMLLRVDEDDWCEDTFNINNVDFDKYDGVVVADYDKGYLSVKDLIEIGKQSKWSFIDTKKYKDFSYFQYFDFIKMNEAEWEKCRAHGAKYQDVEDKLIVTKSQKGCTHRGVTYPVDNSVEVRDVSGAGDTWTASFVWDYLHNKDTKQAIRVANENATKVVQKRGVSFLFLD